MSSDSFRGLEHVIILNQSILHTSSRKVNYTQKTLRQKSIDGNYFVELDISYTRIQLVGEIPKLNTPSCMLLDSSNNSNDALQCAFDGTVYNCSLTVRKFEKDLEG